MSLSVTEGRPTSGTLTCVWCVQGLMCVTDGSVFGQMTVVVLKRAV